MADCAHWIGSDLSTDNTGDLAAVGGNVYGTQRVLRRLITVATTYIWHLTYGAGLPQYVGSVENDNAITAVIMAQIFLEDCVARSPSPTVTLAPMLNGVNVTVAYTDANTGTPMQLSFDVGPQ
jgi:hypothetical protein